MTRAIRRFCMNRAMSQRLFWAADEGFADDAYVQEFIRVCVDIDALKNAYVWDALDLDDFEACVALKVGVGSDS